VAFLGAIEECGEGVSIRDVERCTEGVGPGLAGDLLGGRVVYVADRHTRAGLSQPEGDGAPYPVSAASDRGRDAREESIVRHRSTARAARP